MGVLTMTFLRPTQFARGASTTAAVNRNVPLDDVMKMADWSRVSTFQKFYYKPILKVNYAQSVLQYCSRCPSAYYGKLWL